MPAPKQPTRAPSSPAGSTGGRAKAEPEVLRRARFQNLMWREARARATHLIGTTSGGPNPPQPDVPAEWLREYDRHSN
jgi:hypothetical protein